MNIPSNKIIIYTDGGARGNPGPAAVGVVIESHDDDPSAPRLHKKFKKRLGETTNNIAEYSAVVLAFKEAKKVLGKNAKSTEIELRTDSELVCKQMMGDYRIKNANLKILAAEAKKLILKFKMVRFVHVRRENNREADKLVNEALDEV